MPFTTSPEIREKAINDIDYDRVRTRDKAMTFGHKPQFRNEEVERAYRL